MKLIRELAISAMALFVIVAPNVALAGINPATAGVETYLEFGNPGPFGMEWEGTIYRSEPNITNQGVIFDPSWNVSATVTILKNQITIDVGGVYGYPPYNWSTPWSVNIIHIYDPTVRFIGATIKSSTVTGFDSSNILANYTHSMWGDLEGDGLFIDMSMVSKGVIVLEASTVPEAETYAMLLAGLGLMGVAARRRKQA
jgi:hypothetical protein